MGVKDTVKQPEILLRPKEEKQVKLATNVMRLGYGGIVAGGLIGASSPESFGLGMGVMLASGIVAVGAVIRRGLINSRGVKLYYE